jgi:hypothetical protein
MKKFVGRRQTSNPSLLRLDAWLTKQRLAPWQVRRIVDYVDKRFEAKQ